MGMREEFEAATYAMCLRGVPDCDLTVEEIVLSRRGDEYATPMWSFAWWAWKESRATLVVTLPEAYKQFQGDTHPSMFASEVLIALTEVGVSYK